MSRESLVLLLGLVVLFVPVIGVPTIWKNYLVWIIGSLLIIVGISLRRSSYLRKIQRSNGEIGNDSFVESQPSLLDSVSSEDDTKTI